MGRFHRHDGEHDHHHHHGDHEHHHHDHEHEHHDLGDHSGYETGRQRIDVLEDIFHENDHRAAENRAAFDAAGVVAINVMSSPGAGKTTLLERTIGELGGERFGVVEGDIETALDAQRLERLGARVSLLNTGNGFGGECHLDAPMVAHALEGLDLSGLEAVFIENVGNLVCPAEFQVGEHHKIMVASVTEGEDKPLKYPVMFRSVEAVVINKIDLLPYLPFRMPEFLNNIKKVNPDAAVLPVSCTSGEGLKEWYAWLENSLLTRGATGA